MMEKFLMCFINRKRQIIELKRRGQEKRARRMATRPEPTIIGNCEGWSAIVGKKPAPMSLNPTSEARCCGATSILRTAYPQPASRQHEQLVR
jgi:hypothetical protein